MSLAYERTQPGPFVAFQPPRQPRYDDHKSSPNNQPATIYTPTIHSPTIHNATIYTAAMHNATIYTALIYTVAM